MCMCTGMATERTVSAAFWARPSCRCAASGSVTWRTIGAAGRAPRPHPHHQCKSRVRPGRKEVRQRVRQGCSRAARCCCRVVPHLAGERRNRGGYCGRQKGRGRSRSCTAGSSTAAAGTSSDTSDSLQAWRTSERVVAVLVGLMEAGDVSCGHARRSGQRSAQATAAREANGRAAHPRGAAASCRALGGGAVSRWIEARSQDGRVRR
jgi:hypothetical protein